MVQADIFGSYFLEIKNLYFPKISSTSFLKFSFPLIPLTHGIWQFYHSAKRLVPILLAGAVFAHCVAPKSQRVSV